MDAIFVVGTGRSGTHFTLRCLREFTQAEDYLGGAEHSRTLRRVAITAMKGKPLSGLACLRYRWLAARARRGDKVFLDQHHPNLFHVDQLAALIPGAVFLYPDRPAVQIVASMLRHKGVSNWYADIRSGKLDLPYPNPFFGLSSADEATSLPPHLLAMRRVLAHRRRAEAERQRNPGRFRFVPYADLVTDRQATFAQVFTAEERLQLGPTVALEKSEPNALKKYLDVLTPSQIAEIEAADDRL